MIAKAGAGLVLLGFCAILVTSTGAIAQPTGEDENLPLLEQTDADTADKVQTVEGDVPMPAPITGKANKKIALPEGDEAEFSSKGVTESPDPKGPDLYYDSNTVPVTKMSREAGPRKPDPRKEPASKFIVVEKTHGSSSSESQIVAASRALKLERYASAVELYENLKKKNSRDPRILMGLAVAYQKNGQIDAAIRAYQRFLDVHPDNIDAKANMLGLMRERAPAEALRGLLDLRDQEPSNPWLAAQIGLAHADLGNFDEAMRYLGMAASLAPENPKHLYNMAVVADRAGKKAKAVELYKQALEVDAVQGESGLLAREVVYDRLSVLRK